MTVPLRLLYCSWSLELKIDCLQGEISRAEWIIQHDTIVTLEYATSSQSVKFLPAYLFLALNGYALRLALEVF